MSFGKTAKKCPNECLQPTDRCARGGWGQRYGRSGSLADPRPPQGADPLHRDWLRARYRVGCL